MFAGELVTIVRDSGSWSPEGDWIPGTVTRTDVQTVVPLAFTSSTEDTERGRAGSVTGAKLYLPTGTDILRTDQIEVRGLVYEVDGEVADWRWPTAGSGAPGIEVALKRGI